MLGLLAGGLALFLFALELMTDGLKAVAASRLQEMRLGELAKIAIEELAAAIRKSLLEKLQLADKKDVLSFRLATDMIEQFKLVAHFARRTAAITKEW